MATAVRAITGGVLAASVVAAILFLPTTVLHSMFLLIVALAAFEWTKFCSMASRVNSVLYALGVVVLSLSAGWVDVGGAFGVPVFMLAAGGWVLTGMAIVRRQINDGGTKINLHFVLLLGLGVLPSAFSAIAYLNRSGPEILLFVFGIVWGADVFAYFGGRRFGKRPLASNISPGKTWAGFWSGLIGVFVVLGLFSVVVPDSSIALYSVVASLTFIAAVVGDLGESVLKRNVGLKDSGSILPGHGGILDRVDSMLAAAPVAAAIIWSAS